MIDAETIDAEMIDDVKIDVDSTGTVFLKTE